MQNGGHPNSVSGVEEARLAFHSAFVGHLTIGTVLSNVAESILNATINTIILRPHKPSNKDGVQFCEIDIDTIANVGVNISSCPGAEQDSASQPKDNREMAKFENGKSRHLTTRLKR